MPKRKSTVQVYTPAAQGEDSWIEFEPRNLGEALGITPKQYANNLEEVKARVKAWNWVDADGAPLEQPTPDGDVWNCVTNFEMAVLARVVLGMPGEDELKN